MSHRDPAPGTAPAQYEPPRVEAVLTVDALEREVLLAGPPSGAS